MRLILGLGLANLMPGCCAAHFSALHRCSPAVSPAAVQPLQLQISGREQGRAICGCLQPCSAAARASSQIPGAGALEPARLFGSSEGVGVWEGFAGAQHHNSPSPVTSTAAPSALEGSRALGKPDPGSAFQQPGQSLDRGSAQVMAPSYQPCSPSQHKFLLKKKSV